MGWIEETTATPTVILASGHHTSRAITVASGAGSLEKGTVMGQYNTGVNSGTYASYDNSVSNGLEVAAGVLTDKVDASASGAQGAVYTHAQLIEENLTGLDATAKSDLKNIVFISNV